MAISTYTQPCIFNRPGSYKEQKDIKCLTTVTPAAVCCPLVAVIYKKKKTRKLQEWSQLRTFHNMEQNYLGLMWAPWKQKLCGEILFLICSPRTAQGFKYSQRALRVYSNECPTIAWTTIIAKQSKTESNGEQNCNGQGARGNGWQGIQSAGLSHREAKAVRAAARRPQEPHGEATVGESGRALTSSFRNKNKHKIKATGFLRAKFQ